MFASDKGAVTFSVLQEKFGKLEVLEGPRTVDCFMIPEEGMVSVDEIGKCTYDPL